MTDDSLAERLRSANEDLEEEMIEMYRTQKANEDDYTRQLLAEMTPCGCH